MYSLRPRTPADCESVVGWIPDMEDLYLFSGPRLTWPLTSSQLSAMEGANFSPWILVENDTDEPVGHFDLTLEGQTARMGRVLIAPEQRGRGLAHVLVSIAIDQAKSLGASELRLNVIAGNKPAIRTYARAGFSELPYPEHPNVSVMSRPL
jgi:RimJ/RimL family protein N-acetyltransferase